MILSLVLAVLLPPPTPADPPAEAQQVLVAIANLPTDWPELHAVAALVENGMYDPVRARFAKEAETARAPFRTPIWRFEAAMAATPEERKHWIGKIEKIAADTAASDQVIAVESLDKLSCRLSGASLRGARHLAETGTPSTSLYGVWALVNAKEPGADARVLAMLSSSDPVARARAGMILRWTRPTDPKSLQLLARAADADKPGQPGYPAAIASAFMLDADPARRDEWRAALQAAVEKGPGRTRWEACEGLMYGLTASDIPSLVPHLSDPESDGRTGAAMAILHILSRSP